MKNLQTVGIRLAILLVVLCLSIGSYGQTYSVGVGETIRLEVPSVSTGYVDKAIWACSNSAISFVSKSESSATIKVVNAFDGYATIELVYVQKYVNSKGFTLANTYYKEYYVSCVGGSSEGGTTSEATSISVEPEIKVAVGEKAKIKYQLYPQGSSATTYYSNRPGTYFSSITNYPNAGYVQGYARAVGEERVTVYFYNSKDEKVSATCNVTVYDPTWVNPQSISIQPVLLLSVDENKKLLPSLSPKTATTLFKWSTDDFSIASISDGTVKAKKNGSATITVKTANGLMGKCNVFVVDSDKRPQGAGMALNRAATMLQTAENETVR